MLDANAIRFVHTEATVPRATLEISRGMARALGTVVQEHERPGLAQAFCYRLVAAWWQNLTAEFPDRIPLRPFLEPLDTRRLPELAISLADSMAAVLAELDVEAAAYEVGLTYTGMLSADYRARLGIYYTPPVLTARLIHQVTKAGVDWTRCRVLDPACGGGAFLAPVAKRMIKALSGCSAPVLVSNVATRLRGYEIDPCAAWLSQVTLDAIFLPMCRAAGCRLPWVVTVRDSLKRSTADEKFDLVIGNPPYGRVRLDPVDRRRYRRSLYGHANLYGLFTDQALRHAKPGGVIAYVTPTSFLSGHYFKNLRGMLAGEAPPATVDFVALRKGVFEDVLQETLLATYKRGVEPAPAAVYEVTPVDGAGLKVKKVGTFSLPTDPSQPWLLPRTSDQARLVLRMRDLPHRLVDWGYTVSTGPLVWNRHKDQLANAPREGRYPLIWAEAVTADGKFVWRAEKKNHALYFEPNGSDDWLITRTPCILLQRTTSREQRRRLIAAALPRSFLSEYGGAVIENHLNMLRPIVDKPLVAPATLAAFLNSVAADQAFRCINGSVAVSAYELEALPLPPPMALTELADLVCRRVNRAHIESTCVGLYMHEDDA